MATQEPSKASTELEGWKEIADYLGIRPRTAQDYEKQRGLPIHRPKDQDKGRVWAYPSELDAWRAERIAGVQSTHSDEARPKLPVEHSVGLPDTEPTDGRKVRQRRIAWVVVAAALCLTAVAALALKIVPTIHSNGPTHYSVEGNQLIVFDRNNIKLWSYALPGVPSPRGRADHPSEYVRELFVDLDLDGKNEFLYVYYDWPSWRIGKHTLYCFRSNGEVMWTRKTGHPINTPLGRRFVSDFYVGNLGALRKPRDDGGRIVVGSYHSYGWPYQVALLDSSGKVVSEYWHPGWLWRMEVADLDGDGVDEIILGGVNDSYRETSNEELPYEATLVVLDSRRISGTGPIVPGDDRLVAGLPSGQEKAVLLFRRLEPITDKNSFFRVMFLNVGENRNVTVRIGAYLNENGMIGTCALFDLDSKLKVTNVVPEANYGARLLQGLPRGASPAAQLARIRDRIGPVKYLTKLPD